MDDRYWEALLRDADDAVDPQHVHADPDEILGDLESVETAATEGAQTQPPQLDQGTDWEWVETVLASKEIVDVVVVGYNRGGLLTRLRSLQGFLPASHLLTRPAVETPAERMAALAAHVHRTLSARVIEIDREHHRLILSERLAQQDGEVQRILANLQPGQVCRGTVTNLCPFGAFVDLGGFEGLIHISELSWGRVESPRDVVQPGDCVESMVLDVNTRERKVSLSLRRLCPDPWRGVESRYRAGQTVDAIITNVVNFGAFARLEEGLEGLIHVSELAEGSFMHPRNVVREGEHVRARVLQVDGSRRRIALTLRSGDFSGHARSEWPTAPQALA